MNWSAKNKMAKRQKKYDIYSLGVPVWSLTKANYLMRCPRRYFFGYVCSSRKDFPITLPQFKGTRLHRELELLFNADRTLKYKSPEAFANVGGHRFNKDVEKGSIRGQPIDFGTDNPEERKKLGYVISATEIKPVLKNAYHIIAEEAPPLIIEQELRFVFQGRAFDAVIDVIRRDEKGNLVIRDYKSGRFAPDPAQAELQLKLYNLAVCTFCHYDGEFRDRLGISAKQAKKYAGNPVYIDPDIKHEIFRLHNNKPEGLHLWRLGSVGNRLKELGLSEMADEVGSLKGRLVELLEKAMREEDEFCLPIEKPETIMHVTENRFNYDSICSLLDFLSKQDIFLREKGDFPPNASSCRGCRYDKQCSQYYEVYAKEFDQRLFTSYEPAPKSDIEFRSFNRQKKEKSKEKKPRQLKLFPTGSASKKKKKNKKAP
jgi:hypothetical protein